VQHASHWIHLPPKCKTGHSSIPHRSSSVEVGIIGYYDPSRLWHAGSQDTGSAILSRDRQMDIMTSCSQRKCDVMLKRRQYTVSYTKQCWLLLQLQVYIYKLVISKSNVTMYQSLLIATIKVWQKITWYMTYQ